MAEAPRFGQGQGHGAPDAGEAPVTTPLALHRVWGVDDVVSRIKLYDPLAPFGSIGK